MSANVIDENVVAMRFDNSQFEKAAQTSMLTLEKLKNSINMSESVRGLEELNYATKSINFDSMARSADAIKVKFSAVNAVMMAGITRLTKKAMNAIEKTTKMFTTQPMSSGFAEYELKMGSVQTIMASTGESVKTVNQYLNELNEYADKTIYSFSDMTQNIGKFTNAGVKLKDATAAMQGISNVAALSGANANEASRAMYNFAQAISSGSVKLIDWKSIELANMATVEFKNELIKTAVEMGTLVKVGDAYNTTTTDMKGSIATGITASKGFNDSLSAQWLTADVLTKTLSRYSDETTEIGKRAYQAATQVKTFHQMLDTLKESAGTGWADTWEILFGDFEQARALFSALTRYFGEIIDSFNDSRNAMLRGFRAKGGIQEVLKTIGYLFKDLGKVLRPLEKGFRDVFPKEVPPRFGAGLLNIVKALESFAKQIEINEEQAKALRQIWRGLFSIVDIGFKAISGLFGLIRSNGSTIGKAITTMLKIGGGAMNLFTRFNKTLEDKGIGKALIEIPRGIVDMFRTLSSSLIDFFDFSSLFGKIKMGVKKIKDIFLSLYYDVNSVGNLFDIVKARISVAVNTIANKVTNAFETIKSAVNPKIEGILHRISESFTDAKASISSFAKTKLDGIDISPLLEFGKSAAGKAGNALKNIGETLSEFGTSIKERVGGAIEFISPYLTSFFNAVVEKAPKVFSTLKNGAITAGGAIAMASVRIWESIQTSYGVVKRVFSDIVSNLKPVFDEVGVGLGVVWEGLKVFFSEIEKHVDISKTFQVLGNAVGSLLAVSTKFLSKVDFAGFFNSVANAITKFIDNVKLTLSLIGTLFSRFKDIGDNKPKETVLSSVIGDPDEADKQVRAELDEIMEAINAFLTRLTAGMNEKQITAVVANAVREIFRDGVILEILRIIRSFNKYSKGLVEAVTGLTKSFSNMFDEASKTLKAYQNDLRAKTLVKIASAVALLAGSIALLALIPADKLKIGLMGMSVLLVEVFGLFKSMQGMEVDQLDGAASVIAAMGAAIALMASSAALLSTIDPEPLVVGLTGLAAILTGLVVLSKNFENNNEATLAASLYVLSLGSILRTMSKILMNLSSVPWNQLLVAGGVMVAFTISLSQFVKSIPDPEKFKQVSKSLVLLGLVTALLTQSLTNLSSVKDPASIFASWTGISAIVAAMAASVGILANKFGSTQIQTITLGFTAFASGLSVLAGSLAIFAAMDFENIIAASGALVVLIGVMTGVTYALSTLPVATATLTAFGIALGGLGTGIGIAVGGISALLFAFNALLITIPKLNATFATGMINMWEGLTKSLPAFETFLGQLISTITKLIPEIVAIGVRIFEETLKSIAKHLDRIGGLILKIIAVIDKYAPKIINRGANLAIKLIDGFTDKVPKLTNKVGKAITVFLESIADNMEKRKRRVIKATARIVNSILDIVTDVFLVQIPKQIKKLGKKLMKNSPAFRSVVEGIGNLIMGIQDRWAEFKEKLDGLKDKLKEIGKNAIEGLKKGVTGAIDGVKKTITNVADTVVNTFKDVLGINSPSKVFMELGNYLIDGLTKGVNDKTPEAKNAAKNAGKDVAEATKEGFDKADVESQASKSTQKTVKKKVDKFKEFIKSIQDTIKGSTSLFEPFETSVDKTTTTILNNLDSQVSGVSQWVEYMHLLSSRGLNKKMFKELLEAGPDSLGDVQTVAMMTNKEFRELNKLYRERQSLNKQTVASSLAWDTKAKANISNKLVQDKVNSAIKNTYHLKTTVDSYTKSLKNTETVDFGKTIDKVASKMTYGGAVLKTFTTMFVTSTNNSKLAKNAIDATTSAIEKYGKTLWKNSTYYATDSKAMSDLTQNLEKLSTKRDALRKKLQQYTKDHNSMAKERAYAVANTLKATNKAMKSTERQIAKTTKQIAKHTKEVFSELKNSISSTITSFLDPFKAGLEDTLDLFADMSSTATATYNLEELQNRQLYLKNQILKLNQKNTLASRLEAKSLNEELEEVNKQIESITGQSADASVKTMDDILNGMDAQISAADTIKDQLAQLQARGLSTGIISYLKGLGTEGASTISTFLNATDDQLDRANKYFEDKTRMSATNLVDSFTKSLDVTKAWSSNMRALAERGLDPKILEKLGAQGPEMADTVAALLTLPDDKLQEFNAQYANALTLPDTVANQIMSSYVYAGNLSTDGFLQAINAVSTPGSDQNTKLVNISANIGAVLGEMLRLNGRKATKQLVKALSNGLEDGKQSASKAAGNAAQSTIKALREFLNKNNGSDLATNLANGLIEGLSSNDNNVRKAAKQIAKGALEAAQQELGIASPSKKFMAIGEFVNAGFVKGLEKTASSSETATRDIMSKTISEAYNAISGGVDTNIVITPSLNLANIQNGVNSIDNMLNNSYEVGVTANRMAGISDTFNSIQAMHAEHMSALDRLQRTISGLSSPTEITLNNTFNVTDANPSAIADDISRQIQFNIQRRNAAWA